jgi:hypothetical protein
VCEDGVVVGRTGVGGEVVDGVGGCIEGYSMSQVTGCYEGLGLGEC